MSAPPSAYAKKVKRFQSPLVRSTNGASKRDATDQPNSEPPAKRQQPQPPQLQSQPQLSQLEQGDYRKYGGMYRTRTTAKNKGWENDGILVVTGVNYKLLGRETEKIVTMGRLDGKATFDPDDVVLLGNLEMIIEDQIEGNQHQPQQPSVPLQQHRPPPAADLTKVAKKALPAPTRPPPPPAIFSPLNSSGIAPAQEAQEPSKYFTGQYRKFTPAKNKGWEADGLLVVEGRNFRLLKLDDGKPVTSGRLGSKDAVKIDEVIRLGGLEMLPDEEIDERFYLSGKCFSKGFVPIAAVSQLSKAPFEASVRLDLPVRTPDVVPEPPKRKFSALVPNNGSSKERLATLTAPVTSKSFFTSPLPGAKSGMQTSSGVRGPVHPIKEGSVVMPQPNEQALRMAKARKEDIVDVVIDPVLGKALRPHQVEGVKFMYSAVMGMRCEGQGCILADDMGLGKTLQAIALIYTLIKQSPFNSPRTAIQRAVIVCPVTLLQNWQREIRKWLGRDRLNCSIAETDLAVQQWTLNRSAHVLIIGYERLQASFKHLTSAASGAPVGLIICDEGHKLKSKTSKINAALNSFTKCSKRIILSGTPVQNNLAELHTMVDWIIPDILDDYKNFKRIFEEPILRSRQPGVRDKVLIEGQERAAELKRTTDLFLLRRTSDIIARFLPPKIEYTITVIPTALEVAIQGAILGTQTARKALEGTAMAQQLSLLGILRKLCNSPGLLVKSRDEGKGLEFFTDRVVALLPSASRANEFDHSGKLMLVGAMLKRMSSMRRAADQRAQAREARGEEAEDDEDAGKVEDVGREKIVVVSNFTSTLDFIESYCTRKNYASCRLDGNTAQSARQPMVDAFNKDTPDSPWVFLLSSKSGGTGLNIIGASRLVLVDSDWNPSNDLQAMARIHRDGQKRQCVIYRLLTAGTMDEKIFQRQVTKLGLTGSVMDGGERAQDSGRSKAKGEAAGGGDSFTMAELKEVFNFHPDVACQTHDLLGCQCTFGQPQIGSAVASPAAEDEGADAGPSSSWNEGERIETAVEKPYANFVPASQMPDEPKPDTRHLSSALRDWTHHDCAHIPGVDRIEDQLLKDVIHFRATQCDFNQKGFVPEQHKPKAGEAGVFTLRGGMVGFAFEKRSSGETAPK